MTIEDVILLDVRNLLCPLPVIRVQNAVKTLSPKQILRVLATDPGVLYDIPAWCRIHGFTIKDIQQQEKEIEIEIVI